MDFYDVVNARYSARKYSDRPVPEEALLRMLEAARVAPSACNIQPWHIYVVQDEATRRQLFPPDRQGWAADAPVVLVACSYPDSAWKRSYDGKNHADIDLGIVTEHLVLAAAAEGLGTCWICAFDPELFRTVLQLPAGMEPVAATPLGYPDCEPRPRNRKPLEEIITWR